MKNVASKIMHLFSTWLVATLACGPAYAGKSVPDAESHLVVLGMSPLREESYGFILQILLEDAAQSRREEGVISWDLFRPEDGKRDLLAVERYMDRAAFERHLEAPYVKAFIENIPTAVRDGEEQSALFMKDLLPAEPKPILSPQTTKNIIAVLSVKQEAVAAVVDALFDAAKAARRESGNLVYDVYQDVSNPRRLVVFQRWETASSYDSHHQQASQARLDSILEKSLTQSPREIWRAVRDIGR